MEHFIVIHPKFTFKIHVLIAHEFPLNLKQFNLSSIQSNIGIFHVQLQNVSFRPLSQNVYFCHVNAHFLQNVLRLPYKTRAFKKYSCLPFPHKNTVLKFSPTL